MLRVQRLQAPKTLTPFRFVCAKARDFEKAWKAWVLPRRKADAASKEFLRRSALKEKLSFGFARGVSGTSPHEKGRGGPKARKQGFLASVGLGEG